jgi:translation initiation factor 5
MSININRKSDDIFYRYKMPDIKVRQAGKGNGCYTFIDNIEDICKSINTPSIILLNYIARVLGSNFNDKKQTITGHYTYNQMLNIMYDYIDYFVLCNRCTIPELTPKIVGDKKKKSLFYSCSACGKEYNLYSDTKIYSKTIDSIIKYYNIHKYIPTKGTMVNISSDPFQTL